MTAGTSGPPEGGRGGRVRGWRSRRPESPVGGGPGEVGGAVGGDEAPASLPQPRSATASPVLSRHAAAVLRGEADLLAVALPFLDAGLRAGDVVALSCPPEVAALLCEELGERAEHVRNEPGLSLLGARGPDALAYARRIAEQEPGSGQLRLLALADFGPGPAGWREGVRFESATNRVLQRSEEHTSELQSRQYLVCRLLLEKKKILL